MRFSYNVYPNAINKLRDSGIESRIDKLKNSEEGLPYLGGAIFESELMGIVNDLKEKGYYKKLPKDFAPRYKEIMNGMLNNPEKYFWTIEKPTGIIKEPCDLEDMLLFTGDFASIVLESEEIWDYKKFGFSSPSELITTTGALVKEKSSNLEIFREGYKWTRKRKDGSEIVTNISGDHNADLRIFQTDIAPYLTTDPFGNKIEMRPTNSDIHTIAAYHSTESSLLMSVLKYIEQQKIQTEFQKDNAKEIIEWGKNLGQGGGTCAEHFGGNHQNPKWFFERWEIPIPRLNEKNESTEFSPFGIPVFGEGLYLAYVSNEGDLILSYQNKDLYENPKKTISAKFLPEDAEHLVKGLIYQSAKGLGRTSAKQLLDILEFRYSPQFKKDIEEMKKF